MPAKPRVQAKTLPKASAVKSAAEAKRLREQERKARLAEATAKAQEELDREQTAIAEASLKVTEAKNRVSAAERRTQRAIARAENTEALLAQERARVEELQAAMSAGPGDGEYNADRASHAATGVPTPGKKTSEVVKTARANLYAAFEDMGGVQALVRWGQSQPTEFYRIWARLIPVEVEDETKKMPLETLLEMLSSRAEQSVEQAAREIGQEVLDRAKDDVDLEAAASLFEESQK
jgi:hypothetical protein